MFDADRMVRLGRNLLVYAAGVSLLIVAALGMAEAIDVSMVVAAPLFVVGLVLVLIVHEYFGGPI